MKFNGKTIAVEAWIWYMMTMLLVLNQKPLVDLIDIELKRIIKALDQCKNSRTKKWKQNKGIKKSMFS